MIPATAHFVWFGEELPYTGYLAIASAVRRGGYARVVLHHADDLTASAGWRALQALPGCEGRRLDPGSLFDACAAVTPALPEVYARLEQPAARANLVRAAVLWSEGGVYLDTDTITVRPITPQLAHGAFCGLEHVLVPRRDAGRSSVLHRRRRWALSIVRERLGARPYGWRAFRRLRWLYPTAANNAVLGAEPGHPAIRALLEGAACMPQSQIAVRYALGTHLLQEVVEGPLGGEVEQLAPDVFYPLPPILCRHWFRTYPDAAECLAEVVRPETLVVHWYASNETRETLAGLDGAAVRARAREQMFAALAAPLVG